MEEIDPPWREAWREANRGFVARNYPIELTRLGLEHEVVLDRERWARACEMGWIAALIPETAGGLGVGLEAFVDLAEELARGLVRNPFAGCVLAAGMIAADPALAGGPILGAVLDGSTCSAWCVAEDERPWTAGEIRLALEPDVAGYRLNGVKSYVLDADVADVLLVSARSGNNLRNVIVPAGDKGVEIVPMRALDLTRSICTVRFNDVLVPVVSEDWDASAAEHAVRWALGLGTLLVSADAIGAAQRLMEMTVEYALQREVFGRLLASYQAVKHKCADMLCGLEAARVATLAAARSLALAMDGDDHAMTAAERALHVLKSTAGEACSRTAGDALQLHGGIGFTWEHNLHLYLRRIKADEALFGPVAWHRDALGRDIIRRARNGQ